VSPSNNERLNWLGPVKALALIGILWNHVIEEFFRGPWFTNPSSGWSSLRTRLSDIFPTENGILVGLVQMIGWLGDSCPGVFILLSGFALAMSALTRRLDTIPAKPFYQSRLVRILPLYVAMHFLFFGLALLIPETEISVGHRRSLLSLMGLRFTEGLFFYISPSWWFVWLVLQLYVLFPGLYWLMKRVNLTKFLIITCGVTFVVRGVALAGIHPGSNVYFTLTGMLCLTRLAEFAVGMAAAKIMVNWQTESVIEPRVLIGKYCLASYLVGFVASWFWYGAIISNLLVSIGLTGLLYFAWHTWCVRSTKATAILTWIGAESFSIFLVHQPLLMWTKHLFGESTSLRAVAVMAALVVSLPLAWLVRVGVEKASNALGRWRHSPNVYSFLSQFALALPATLGFVYLIAFSSDFAQSPRVDAFIVAALVLAAGLMQWVGAKSLPKLGECLNIAFITTGFALLYVLPEGSAMAAVVMGAAFSVVFATVRQLCEMRGRYSNWIRTSSVAGCAALCLAFVLEISLWRIAPLETAAWGELPALTKHETRGYGLKPNLDLRLKYNNYDYQLKTNSLGLVGPDVKLERDPSSLRILVLGDAFSMPEGVEYEKSYPAILQRSLVKDRQSKSVEVISAGVTGYGPRESLAQIRELAPELKPDIVIYQFFVNEFGEVVLDSDFRRQAIGLDPSGSIEQQIFLSTQLYSWSERIGSSIREQLTGYPDEWRYRKALLHYLRAGENPFYTHERVSLVERFVGEIKDVVDKHGARLVLMYVPAAAAVTAPENMEYFPRQVDVTNPKRFDINRPRRLIHEIGGRLGIPILDLSDALKSNKQQPVYFPESWHWNEEGHRVAAQEIVSFLKNEAF
jgi:peptidoglycan/LPS O-acetylase OafA/YrhL